jgi:predicted RND superfamily exporter protein
MEASITISYNFILVYFSTLVKYIVGAIYVNEKRSSKPDMMKLIAAKIVEWRFIILVLFLAAAVYCILSIGKVKVNDDITAFLPEETETRQGLTIMENEFTTYASAEVMVSNLTYEAASELADELAQVEHVTDVTFDDTKAHFVHSSALFSISFDGEEKDDEIIAAMDEIRTRTAQYDTYISSQIGVDYTKTLASEMTGVILLVVAIIVAVLLFTSRSYFEVVIFFIVFLFAAVLNMGTNFWLGEISSITNSIAVILQLALAIDYAIIFSHRYQDEAERYDSHRDALIEALSKAIIEISSSSLTTISGLIALTMMQFRLGYDLGIVLSKGILCSLITVFLLMPCLIMLFPKLLRKTAHKSLIPNIQPWGKFLMKTKSGFVLLFLLIIPCAILLSNQTKYVFDESSVDEMTYSESRAAMHKIDNTFDHTTTIAILVPSGNFEAEKIILQKTAALEPIKTATGLANIEIDDDHVLTDGFTPRMFAELLDIDIEKSKLLFQAYGAQHEEYQAIFGNTAEYKVPLVDLFLYLFEKIDQGIVVLDDDTMDSISDLRSTLEQGVAQLRGDQWNRLILTASTPVESPESTALVDHIRTIAEQQYGEGNVLVVGNITSARDLSNSFHGDSSKINLLTIAFVFIILLFTFRSVVGSAILVFVIQGSIWMNFACTTLSGMRISFVTNMIVSAIQMGATIDYAIVLMNRYQTLKETLPKKEAMAQAVNDSFATVLTSGSIMIASGFSIAYRIADVYICHIGLAVGRGALISVVLVLTVLPQFICLFDRLIEKTKFKINLKQLGGDSQ